MKVTNICICLGTYKQAHTYLQDNFGRSHLLPLSQYFEQNYFVPAGGHTKIERLQLRVEVAHLQEFFF